MHDPAKSAKPPSPVQIRAAPPIFRFKFDRLRSSSAGGCLPIGLPWTTNRQSIAVATAATRWARTDCAFRSEKGGGLQNLLPVSVLHLVKIEPRC